MLDGTGADAGQGQTGGVFFVAGTATTDPVQREFTVPLGKALFLPIINTVWIATEPTDPQDEAGILAIIEPYQASKLDCRLDGQKLKNPGSYYTRSGLFDLSMPDGNVFGLPPGTYGPSMSVGYYVFVAPPSVGRHEIRIKAAMPDGFGQDLRIKLRVLPPVLNLQSAVILGDSISAGYRDAGLADRNQETSWAAQVFQQAGANLAVPLIGWPGIPSVLEIKAPGPLPVLGPVAGTSVGRLNPLLQTHNLAVPGHTVGAALQLRPNFPIDSLTDLVLGLPGLLAGVSKSQIEWAEALHPATTFVWLGNNDILFAAIAGDANLVTPAEQLEAQFKELMDRLALTGSEIVVATVPDVTTLPYLVPAPKLAAILGIPFDVLGAQLGVAPGDYLNLDGIPSAVDILLGHAQGPLPSNRVITAAEVAQLQQATGRFNRFVARQAREKRALVVDTGALLSVLDKYGATVNGQTVTTDYVGGIFSLDGIHLTEAGSAITANLFIAALNRHGANIPPVPGIQVGCGDRSKTSAVAKSKAIVPQGIGTSPGGGVKRGTVSRSLGEAMIPSDK